MPLGWWDDKIWLDLAVELRSLEPSLPKGASKTCSFYHFVPDERQSILWLMPVRDRPIGGSSRETLNQHIRF